MKTIFSRAAFAAGLFSFFVPALFASASINDSGSANLNLGTATLTRVSGADPNAYVRIDNYGAPSISSPSTSVAWALGSYSYRRDITVASNYASALTNYQVLLVLDTLTPISEGRMLSSGADLRFVVSGSATPLSYWIESGLNTSATRIWVKVPSIAAGGSVTLTAYYGYASATAVSSTSTFVFADAFPGSSLDTGTWSYSYAYSAVSTATAVSNGTLTLTLAAPSEGPTNPARSGIRLNNDLGTLSGYRFHTTVATNSNAKTGASFMLSQEHNASAYSTSKALEFYISNGEIPRYGLRNISYGAGADLVSGNVSGTASVDIMLLSTATLLYINDSLVYSGAATSLTYLYMFMDEISTTTAVASQVFGPVYVTKYATTPSVTLGGEQGKFYPGGSFSSREIDTGASGSLVQTVNWADVVGSSTSLTVAVRADDTDVTQSTWVTVSKGAAPSSTVQGRIYQYKVDMSESDVRYSPTFSSLTFTFISPPHTPDPSSGQPLSSSTIQWSWTDNSSGQYQEQGFNLLSSAGVYLATTTAGTVSYTEVGLSPNMLYTRRIRAYNQAGYTDGSLLSTYSGAAPPNVTANKTAGV
ncbi:MAG: DUF2341 domain-containing protein, partial [Candidatus Izemoplasmatales bacterium]|nr:DUF2341 domain-containing protein [Candidatus Izemoplasmatales bacterium]